jgi:hypothetical protein
MGLLDKKIRIFEYLIIIISLVIFMELFYAWNSHTLKENSIFPAFRVIGFTFLVSEMLVVGFLFLGFFYFLIKVTQTGVISFGSKIYSSLTLLLIFAISLNLVAGLFFFMNPRFFGHLRGVILPCTLFIVFMNLDINPLWEKRIFRFMISGLIILSVILLMDFFYPDFLSFLRAEKEYSNPLYILIISMLLFNVAATKLIFSKFSIRWFLVLFICFANNVLRFYSKVSILILFISCVVLIYFYSKRSRFGSVRALFYICTAISLMYLSFGFLPQQVKDYSAYTLASRYLKVESQKPGAVYEGYEFDVNILEAIKEKDVSAGRFGIWKFYLKESLNGYGMAPYGFGHDTWVDWGTGVEFGKGAHNILVYFAYHCGLFAAAIMIVAILYYIYSNIKLLSRIKPGLYGNFQREELIGIFAFTLSVIAENMIGIGLSNVSLSWFFWFCVAVLVKRRGILKVSLENGKKPLTRERSKKQAPGLVESTIQALL